MIGHATRNRASGHKQAELHVLGDAVASELIGIAVSHGASRLDLAAADGHR